MKITRRDFVRTSAAAAIGTGVLSSTERAGAQVYEAPNLFPIPPESTTDPLNYLSRQHFEPFVNSLMTVRGSDGRSFTVRLIEATDRTHSLNEKNGYTGECYSLIFESRKKTRMAPDIYSFDHPTLGRFSLTILPVERGGALHEAIVNRISPTTHHKAG